MANKKAKHFQIGEKIYDITDQSVDAKINAVNANIEAKFDVRYSKTRAQYNADTIYVAASGSNSNPGTSSRPVATLYKAIQLGAAKSTVIKIIIKEAGNYPLSQICFNALNIHLSASVDGVSIALMDSCTFYNAHLNIGSDDHRITINSYADGSYWHFDGGQLYAENVRFNCYLEVNSCGSMFINCLFANIHVRVCNAILRRCSFVTPVRNDHGAIWGDTANICIYESLTVNLGADASIPFIQMRYAMLSLACDVTVSGSGKYATAYDCNYITFMSSNTHYESAIAAADAEGTFAGQKYITDVSTIGGASGTDVYGSR